MLTKVFRICFAIAVVTLVLWVSNALADTVRGSRTTTCVGAYGLGTCVENWYRSYDDNGPRQRTAQEIAESEERDRKWAARCRPTLRQDRYGVERYVYAVPDCEFGRTQD
jgi:hypothetical protein